MFARSVLWGVREIERCLETLHQEPMLAGKQTTTRYTDRARTTLRELLELLRGVSLHRPSNPATRDDETLGSVLTVMYAERDANVDILSSKLPDGEQTITSLRSAGQIETNHGEVYIPLQGVDSAQNWPPVLQLLVQRLGEFVGETRNIVNKLRADGTDSQSVELSLARSLLHRLEHLRTVLRSHLGKLQVVNYSVFVDTQIERFITDIVPSAFGIDTTAGERQ